MLHTFFPDSITFHHGYQFPTMENNVVRDIILNKIQSEAVEIKEAKLVLFSQGQDYILPDGITVNELDTYSSIYLNKTVDSDFETVLQEIGEMNNITLQNSYHLQGVASCIKYEDIISVFPLKN